MAFSAFIKFCREKVLLSRFDMSLGIDTTWTSGTSTAGTGQTLWTLVPFWA